VFRLIENIMNVSMGVAGLIWAVVIGVEIWRLWQTTRPPAVPPMPHSLSV
jgi:hypothetical protein